MRASCASRGGCWSSPRSLYLGLILATYTKTDPGWSFSGTGAPIGNRGGVVGAWIADLLLYLFGVSAWWWVIGGVVLVVAGFRRVVRPDAESDHPFAPGRARLRARARCQRRARGAPAVEVAGDRCRSRRAARSATRSGRALARAFGFNGATLLLLALFAVGLSLLFGISWLSVMERIGARLETLRRLAPAPPRAAVDRKHRRRGDRRARARRRRSCARKRTSTSRWSWCPRPRHVPKSERVVKEKQRPLFTDMPDSPLPPLALLDDAPPTQETVSTETLEFTSRLIEKQARATSASSVKVVAAYPGPVITRYEIEPAVGVKGAQIVNLVKDLARALSVVSIRVVETIPGKSCMGLELPNPQAADRCSWSRSWRRRSTTTRRSPLTLALGKDIAGKPVVADLARMPHLLVAGTTGSGKSVGDQRDDPVAAVQGRADAGAPDPDRPEDARAVGVRGHSAPAGAGGHRHEAGGQRAATGASARWSAATS